MNKEEIKKAIKIVFNEDCKECYFPKRKCASCVREEKKKIKKHIKQLEQKESILDKVTDKLKEDIIKTKEEIKYWEERYKNAKGDNKKSFYRQINRCQSRFETLREILNIIEGEKK